MGNRLKFLFKLLLMIYIFITLYGAIDVQKNYFVYTKDGHYEPTSLIEYINDSIHINTISIGTGLFSPFIRLNSENITDSIYGDGLIHLSGYIYSDTEIYAPLVDGIVGWFTNVWVDSNIYVVNRYITNPPDTTLITFNKIQTDQVWLNTLYAWDNHHISLYTHDLSDTFIFYDKVALLKYVKWSDLTNLFVTGPDISLLNGAQLEIDSVKIKHLHSRNTDTINTENILKTNKQLITQDTLKILGHFYAPKTEGGMYSAEIVETATVHTLISDVWARIDTILTTQSIVDSFGHTEYIDTFARIRYDNSPRGYGFRVISSSGEGYPRWKYVVPQDGLYYIHVYFRDNCDQTKYCAITSYPGDTSNYSNYPSHTLSQRYDVWTDYNWTEWYTKGETLTFNYKIGYTTGDTFTIYYDTKILIHQLR